jgi:DNA-binding CsgD family transcriptional regulator
MKNENNVLDYPYKNHNLIRKNADDKKAYFDRKAFGSALSGSSPFFFFGCCLIDHSGRQFACIHEHCHRCFKDDLPNEKQEFQALQFHPEDRKLWGEEVFTDILRFINPIPIDELPDYRLSFNHRFIHKNESISEFLLEGTFSRSENSKSPVLNMKVFSEIGDIKTDDTINLTIFRYSILQGYQKVFSKVYAKKCNSFLSLRELEIIALCHEGLSSKMIAQKLNLSIHTVKNHKRNCMEKTLTHNISELINICIKRHWL